MDINYKVISEGEWKVYDEQTYYTKEGEKIDEEVFKEKYPAVMAEKMVILVLGHTLLDVVSFNILRAYYGIDISKTDDEVLEIVKEERLKEAKESTPLERIASALEYIEMTMMEGLVQ